MKSDGVGSPERSLSSPGGVIAGLVIFQKLGIFTRGNYDSADYMGHSHPAFREDTSGGGGDLPRRAKGVQDPNAPPMNFLAALHRLASNKGNVRATVRAFFFLDMAAQLW